MGPPWMGLEGGEQTPQGHGEETDGDSTTAQPAMGGEGADPIPWKLEMSLLPLRDTSSLLNDWEWE